MITTTRAAWQSCDGQHYSAIVVNLDGPDVECLGGLEFAVMKSLLTSKWYIAPNEYGVGSEFRIGPFETAELAWSTLQLLKD